MTNAQMLRHLRRHPHRREVARALYALAIMHRGGDGWYPRPWSRELMNISMEVAKK